MLQISCHLGRCVSTGRKPAVKTNYCCFQLMISLLSWYDIRPVHVSTNMTTAQDPAIANALIDWVLPLVILPNGFQTWLTLNKVHTFNLPHNAAYISSLSKLYDGSIISLILADIDSPYFGDGIVKGRSAGTAASVNWVQHFNARKFPSPCSLVSSSSSWEKWDRFSCVY